MGKKLAETITYFQEKKGYNSLFHLFRKKYESLGRISGTVKIGLFTDEEVDQFALFLGVSPHHLRRKGNVGLPQFEKQLQETKFQGISLLQLLEGYFGEKIQSKLEKQEAFTEAQLITMSRLRSNYPKLNFWFDSLGKAPWISRQILEPGFEEYVAVLDRAFQELPQELERLPLFSQRITGNPHAFDLSEWKGKLWIHLLHVKNGGSGSAPSQAEALNELLLSFHLLRDDIHSFVTEANLIGLSNSLDNPVWKAAAENGAVLNVPMRELMKVDEVKVINDQRDVFVVENSGVFSSLMDIVPDAPLICTHGQFKLAGLRLMDLLVQSGHTLYYSGDFDPEGLLMAYRFKQRYKGLGRYWRMSVSDYEKTEPSVPLDYRYTKLTSLYETDLGDLARAIKDIGKIGYQEAMMKDLVEDLENRLDHSR